MQKTKQNTLYALSLAASLALVPTLSFAEAADYQIDTKGMHASINFKIQHLGYSWLTGRFDKFSGQYHYDDQTLANSHIEVDINTKSVNTNHALRDKHLRAKHLLNTEAHPTAKFVSTQISGTNENLVVAGNFTLNGVTHPIEIKAHKIGEGNDPWGGHRSGFSGTTQIKLADYNITKNLGPASTEVFLELNIEGIKK